MSRGINKWIGIGNCCADPEVRQMASGDSVANITVACNDSYKSKQTGEKVEKTEFVRVVFFGKLADIVGQYLKKGSKVYIEGRLQTRKWQDQAGNDKYTTEIVVDMRGTMQMLDSQGGGAPQQAQPVPQPQNPTQHAAGGGFDDDIPFFRKNSLEGG